MFSRIMTRTYKMSISIFSFTLVIIIVMLSGIMNNSINNFNAPTIHFAYGQSNQVNSSYNNSNNTNSAGIQNTSAKKVHVGDIDIAYKTFGKGKPLLLIAGSGASMDMWDPTVLKQLLANHTVVIFDSRGGYSLMYQYPEEVTAVLETFLSIA